MRKVSNTSFIVVLLSVVIGLLLATGAETDNPGKPKRPQGMDIELSKEDIPRLVEIIRIWKLVDELELKDNQLVEFLPRFKELNSLRSRYFRDRRNNMTTLTKLLDTKSSEKEVKSAIEQFKAAEMSFYEKYRELDHALNSGLTVKQQAKFIVFEDKYRGDIRDLVKKLQDLSNLRDQQPKHQPQTLKQKK